MTEEKNLKIPAHVAIILDGNGRWAERRGLPRTMGHVEGCKAVEQTVEDCGRLGIKYLTVYGFSTENWKREKTEVDALMNLFRVYMKKLLVRAKASNVRVKFLGDTAAFPADIQEGIRTLETETAGNDGLTFMPAINYGARDELRRAMKSLAEDVRDGKLDPGEITEAVISGRLDTAIAPDPDLLIRTGSELRLSNFLLWQCAYTEFYVTDTLWPDFNMDELQKAISAFSGRERRYGGVIKK